MGQVLVSWEWICPSSTTLCHNSGMNMGKCLLIGVIHICNYWASAGSMIMFSHWWVIFEVWVMFWGYSGLHASYCLWTQEWGLVQNEEKVLLMANGVEQLPILNISDLNVYLKDVHVHQWNASYSVPFSIGYLKQHWSKCLSQRCPCTSMKCSLLCWCSQSVGVKSTNSSPLLVSLKSQILKKSHLSLFLFMLQLSSV